MKKIKKGSAQPKKRLRIGDQGQISKLNVIASLKGSRSWWERRDRIVAPALPGAAGQ